jgi:hypothetical protein
MRNVKRGANDKQKKREGARSISNAGNAQRRFIESVQQ